MRTLIWVCFLFTVGCSSVPVDFYTQRATERVSDYPVIVVPASFEPEFEVDFALSGKAGGFAQGAAAGAYLCSPSLAAGPIGLFIFAPCAAVAGVVGGVVVANAAAPKSEIESFSAFSNTYRSNSSQAFLATAAINYLQQSGVTPLNTGDAIKGPNTAEETPIYPVHSGSYLELALLSIQLRGSGQEGAEVCLSMTARGRKVNANGQVSDKNLATAYISECYTPAVWMEEGGIRFKETIEAGYVALAKKLIDKLYFIYHSAPSERSIDEEKRPVPMNVLMPIKPAMPEIYLDLRSIFKQAKHVQGWGGMHFVDVSSLTPVFEWESFPRSFDKPEGGFSDVKYDLKIYASSLTMNGKLAVPARLLLEINGLREPMYALVKPLEPCGWYYWSVRARFMLNGSQRTTEWAGAYYTAGGEMPPLDLYYFPFRTPDAENNATCWK